MWFVHPLSRTHSVALRDSSCRWISASYEIIYFRVKNMTSNSSDRISSNSATDIAVWGREKWVFHFFMISLRPFKHSQVSSKFFKRSSSSRDLTLHKRLVLFLHHPHLEGWQRVHHSASSIRERWHRSQSTSFHGRWVRVSIWISREILRGLMNIIIWIIMHIFIALRLSCETEALAR